MKLDMQTIAGIITRGDRILERLRGLSVPDTIKRLKPLVNDPVATSKLLGDLDALEQHLRVLKLVELKVETA